MDNCLDPHLWYACAGGMAQIPPPNSRVFYFPQGHAEHANQSLDFLQIPPVIPCLVSSVKYLADSGTDEVYATIKLLPLNSSRNEFDSDAESTDADNLEKSNSFAKTLTQSDANNGGGFSVPRYCAETIFPPLDYTAEPPVQTILARDVHGEVWKFRHIYRGTPRRHLLTTGWSSFVNQKKLLAGDSIVFLRAENGDLCIGIRRAKGGAAASGWNACGGYGGYPEFKKGESVMEAGRAAARGEAFEVVYYPRASSPEFVVRAAAVGAAMRVRWCAGMRFKMAFETEDSSRISWFMGTVSSLSVDDSIRWPNSPWRLLEVVWDEPELLHNLKRVNPWQVELVSHIPAIHLSPFSPPRKRPRFPHSNELPVSGQSFVPALVTNPVSPSSPLCCLPESISAGVQGTRHVELQSSDLHFPGLKPFDFKLLDHKFLTIHSPSTSLLKIASSTGEPQNEGVKAPMFVLFGQPILTAEQMSGSSSADTNSFSEGNHENIESGSAVGNFSVDVRRQVDTVI